MLTTLISCSSNQVSKPVNINSKTVTSRSINRPKINMPKTIRYTTTSGGSRSCGTIPYSSTLLPIVSPDGSKLATATGRAIKKSEFLSSMPSDFSGVLIEQYAPNTNGKAESIAIPNQNLMIGRSATNTGFLVEGQTSKGNRSIGFVNWETNNIKWLVDNGKTNAFAVLNNKDELAWSYKENQWALSILRKNKTEILNSSVRSYVYPTWDSSEKGLFAFEISGSTLSAVYFDLRTNVISEAPIKRLVLGKGGISQACQAILSYPANTTTPKGKLCFYHPKFNQMAIWSPLEPAQKQLKLLGPNTFAACFFSNDQWLETIQNELKTRWIESNTSNSLLDKPWIPRKTTNLNAPILLLLPKEKNIELRYLDLVER